MFHRVIAGVVVVAIALAGASRTADAHGVIGLRMFIEPLAVEDANVKNELNLPRGHFVRRPDGSVRSIEASLEKVLYPGRLSVVAEVGRVTLREPAASGWDDVEIGVKWEAWRNAPHEVAVSGAMFAGLPTGSSAVSEGKTALRPMLMVAKGFGDLPAEWLRPLAVQGDLGYERAADGSTSEVIYGAVVMYSLPYLNHYVRQANAGRELEHTLRTGLSWAALWGNLFPFVEVNARRPRGEARGERSTLLRSGACWMGKYAQISVAADFTLAAGRGARRHGMSVLADWFLDEMFAVFGKTPFGHADHE